MWCTPIVTNLTKFCLSIDDVRIKKLKQTLNTHCLVYAVLLFSRNIFLVEIYVVLLWHQNTWNCKYLFQQMCIVYRTFTVIIKT